MDDDGNYRAGPRLSSYVGLHEAGIVNWLEFDPTDGLVRIRYAPAYERILRSGAAQFADPRFVAAVLADDPVGMWNWIEATAARLDGKDGIDRSRARKPRRDPKASR